MKKLMFALAVSLFVSQFASAKAPQSTAARGEAKRAQICKALYKQAKTSCIESMCEEQFKDPESEDQSCIMDGDFYEGLGICVIDDLLPTAIELYNKKHPIANLNCEGIDY